ncbi:MAG TPA: hypothetical protein VFE65_05950 [Pseudonocardia sp.]|nr:hypothetical protein [Pseudonocardia sp.]
MSDSWAASRPSECRELTIAVVPATPTSTIAAATPAAQARWCAAEANTCSGVRSPWA